eukprot:jgi/Bigna1/131519/aug1.14_g6227
MVYIRMTERKRSHLNLAQRVGLLEKPAPKLTEEEWKGLRKTAVDRGSHLRPCPICCDHFGTQPQVILSCSHVFHSACLKSFEKFSGNVVCPICRAKDYQAKLIDDGARIFKQRSIVVIQSWFRGYIARKKYFELLDKKLKQTTKQMVKQVDKKQDALDLLFAQMESNLQLSKMAMEAAEVDDVDVCCCPCGYEEKLFHLSFGNALDSRNVAGSRSMELCQRRMAKERRVRLSDMYEQSPLKEKMHSVELLASFP